MVVVGADGSVGELGTILGVWAHPDDETYLAAGLMAGAVRAGCRVVCITATRGEGGSMDEQRWPTASLGAVREAELLRGLAILGVFEHHFLDLPDIDMDSPLPGEGAEKVRRIMRDVRPDTVLTFGPDGMTDHAAHKSVCAWATEALRSTAKPGARLFYATYTPEWAAEFVPEMNRFDVFRPGTPPVTPRSELGIDFPLPADLLELKLAAIQEHESQVGGMVEAFGEDFFRRAMRQEYFRLAKTARGQSTETGESSAQVAAER
jgi:LmbE family N-acetylglucosaminyl deacetylase